MNPRLLLDFWAALPGAVKLWTSVVTAVSVTAGGAVATQQAWIAYDLPVPASRGFVIAQQQQLNRKVEQIYTYQREDRLERLETDSEALKTKIIDWQAKLHEITDPTARALLQDGLRDLEKKQTKLIDKINTIKTEKQLPQE